MKLNNFLLGRGEELSETIMPPARRRKDNGYQTLNKAKESLGVQAKKTFADVQKLPTTANPGGLTVIALVMHPEFYASQPADFLKLLNSEAIGDQQISIRQQAGRSDKDNGAVSTRMILAKCQVTELKSIDNRIRDIKETDPAAEDITRIEFLKSINPRDKIVGAIREHRPDVLDLEVAIHINPNEEDASTLDGFVDHLDYIGVRPILKHKLQLGSLCFLSLILEASHLLEKVAAFSLVRQIRRMPYVKTIIRIIPPSNQLPQLPRGGPVDHSTTVALFDDGLPPSHPILKWSNSYETDEGGDSRSTRGKHGLGVTSALLFGPINMGTDCIERPYCLADHYRVLYDEQDQGDNELAVLNRIREITESGAYDFINLSLGPDIPIEDQTINPWTVVLDRLVYENGMLATVAIGNNGLLDQESGNARVQPPSDGINVIGVGACSGAETDWHRLDYSNYGPGRRSGIVKPDVVSFGGIVPQKPFYCLGTNNNIVGLQGTSLAAPSVLRTAVGIRSQFGDKIKPLAIKALIIHSARFGSDKKATLGSGWGMVSEDLMPIVATNDNAARILYQGILKQKQWVRIPVPLPPDINHGKIIINATLCYFSDINPVNTLNYSNSGIEVVFRPNRQKKSRADKNNHQRHPDPKPFFNRGSFGEMRQQLNRDEVIWETTRSSTITMLAKSLKEPTFDLQYIARADKQNPPADILRYSMVITISSPSCPDLYNQISTHYQVLNVLKPISTRVAVLQR